MKKIVVTFIGVCAILTAAAQQRHQQIGFGIHAGWSMTRISGNTFDGKAGFIGGVHANFPIGKSFFVQPEINFLQAGGKYETDEFTIGDVRYRHAELNMTYLNVPVLLKYRIKPIDLDIFVGPQIAFNLHAKNKVGAGETYDAYNVKDTYVAGVYGLEYSLPIPDSGVNLFVNARYATGFTDFASDADPNMPNDGYRNNVLAFLLGFRF